MSKKTTVNKEISQGVTAPIENKTKYVDIVSLRIVKDRSIPYADEQIGNPQTALRVARKIAEEVIGDYDREAFLVVCLDTKNKPTSVQVTGIGTINQAFINAREIFKGAILSNSAGIICFHNHPSGCAEPSNNDIQATKNLKKAGELLDIRLIDHIIIGDDGDYYSFKKNGELD